MKKPNGNPIKFPIVEVTWFDHTSSRGWERDKEWVAAPLPECRDVGRIVGRSKNSLTLAAMVCADGDFGCCLKIPYAWVRKIRRLR